MSAGLSAVRRPASLTTISSPCSPSCVQASASRSPPLAWSAHGHDGIHPMGCAGLPGCGRRRLPPPRGLRRSAQHAGPRAPPWAGPQCRPGACRANWLDAMRAGISTVKGCGLQGHGALTAPVPRRSGCGLRSPAAPGFRRAPGRPAARCADEFLSLAVVRQRAFGDGADQQFKQFRVHGEEGFPGGFVQAGADDSGGFLPPGLGLIWFSQSSRATKARVQLRGQRHGQRVRMARPELHRVLFCKISRKRWSDMRCQLSKS